MLASGEQNQRVGRAVRDQHRKTEPLQDVLHAELPPAHGRAYLGRHHHVESEHGLEFILRWLLLEAVAEKAAGGGDVGRQVVRCHAGERLETWAKEALVRLRNGVDIIEAGQLAGPMDLEVVGDDATAVGPTDQHRALQSRGVDNSLHLVRPKLGLSIALRLERLVGPAMPAQVVGDHAKLLGEIALDLPGPGKVALREAVDEENLRAGGIAPFLRHDRKAIRRLDRNRLVLMFLGRSGCTGRHSQAGSGGPYDEMMQAWRCHRVLPLLRHNDGCAAAWKARAQHRQPCPCSALLWADRRRGSGAPGPGAREAPRQVERGMLPLPYPRSAQARI